MLTLQWDVSIPDTIPDGNPLGIDIGLTNFVATSNGRLIKRMTFFAEAERKLKIAATARYSKKNRLEQPEKSFGKSRIAA